MSQKIFTNLLKFATTKRADHLTINAHPGQVTLDCQITEGEVLTIAVPPKLERDFMAALKKLLKLTAGELVNHRHGSINDAKQSWNFYLTVRSEKEGEKIVMKLLNNPTRVWRLNQLGLAGKNLKALKKISARPGLIAVTSLPGQGKSSTLNALLLENNDPSLNVYWLQSTNSNIALNVPGVNYLAPNSDYWHKILNHDSDLIFVDEANNISAITGALRAASSGRRVVIAFSADDIDQAKKKIKDIAVNHGLDNSCLKAVIHQSLVDWPKPSRPKTLRTRSKIGRFKIWLS